MSVYATIGIFTIVQIERNVQMLIPAYDFCIPEKECVTTSDNPCEMFNRLEFPTNEFSHQQYVILVMKIKSLIVVVNKNNCHPYGWQFSYSIKLNYRKKKPLVRVAYINYRLLNIH